MRNKESLGSLYFICSPQSIFYDPVSNMLQFTREDRYYHFQLLLLILLLVLVFFNNIYTAGKNNCLAKRNYPQSFSHSLQSGKTTLLYVHTCGLLAAIFFIGFLSVIISELHHFQRRQPLWKRACQSLSHSFSQSVTLFFSFTFKFNFSSY